MDIEGEQKEKEKKMSKVLIKGTRQILMRPPTVNGGRIRLEKKIVFDLKRCMEMNIWKLNVNLYKLLHLVIAQLKLFQKQHLY